MSGKVWPAYYGGTCSNCGKNFNKGTMVMYEGGRVVEAVCDTPGEHQAASMGPNERAVYREQMCLRCFTVHAPGQEGCE